MFAKEDASLLFPVEDYEENKLRGKNLVYQARLEKIKGKTEKSIRQGEGLTQANRAGL